MILQRLMSQKVAGQRRMAGGQQWPRKLTRMKFPHLFTVDTKKIHKEAQMSSFPFICLFEIDFSSPYFMRSMTDESVIYNSTILYSKHLFRWSTRHLNPLKPPSFPTIHIAIMKNDIFLNVSTPSYILWAQRTAPDFSWASDFLNRKYLSSCQSVKDRLV